MHYRNENEVSEVRKMNMHSSHLGNTIMRCEQTKSNVTIYDHTLFSGDARNVNSRQ